VDLTASILFSTRKGKSSVIHNEIPKPTLLCMSLKKAESTEVCIEMKKRETGINECNRRGVIRTNGKRISKIVPYRESREENGRVLS